MHDPVDKLNDHTGSLGARAAGGEPNGGGRIAGPAVIRLDKAPTIEPEAGAEIAADAADRRDAIQKRHLVTPTMWR